MATKKIDWSYHRPGCKTCQKTQDYLGAASISATVTVNAKKEPIDADGAVELARDHNTIIATKGKKVIRVDMKKDKPTDDELRDLIVGPSGKLRAPAIRKGKTLIVGFSDEMYADALG